MGTPREYRIQTVMKTTEALRCLNAALRTTDLTEYNCYIVAAGGHLRVAEVSSRMALVPLDEQGNEVKLAGGEE